MKKARVWILCTIALLMVGCKDKGGLKVTATGSIYEVLVVMDNPYWEGEAGEIVRASLEADMPCLPQMESYFTVMQTPLNAFDDALKSVRNILITEVNPERYTQARLNYKTDMYAHPQAVAVITAPTRDELTAFLQEKAPELQEYFLRQELLRQAKFYRSFCNHDASELIQKKFGIEIKVPSDYQLIMEDEDFVWCCNDNGPKRRDLVIWSYPYTDPNTFTEAYLCAKRDSVLKRIEGYVEGSYMGTEYKIFPPQFRSISINNGGYCGELRGLWRMKGGAAMGGPFVEHVRVDEINQRVITAESYIYAAGQKKRNTYRQGEAILYTIKLPQEINQLKEIPVKAE